MKYKTGLNGPVYTFALLAGGLRLEPIISTFPRIL